MNDVDNPQEITVLSLCTGYGGLELGLAGALANPLRVVAVEIEAYAVANLVAKAEEGKLAIEALWPDLRTFPAERFRGCFDFVLAGYPCQPFSCAGKRQGAGDPRHLWPVIAGIVKAVEPGFCFFENVPGHLSLGFPDVYCDLRNMGYSVEAGLFTAAECGAPHRRQRLFVLAHKQGQRLSDCLVCRNQKKRPRLTYESCDGKWPARPGQPQYEWEEPRVVGDTEHTGQGRGRRAAQRLEQGLEVQTEKIESRLDRATNGITCSLDVDILRLLGNGVVPQQAEKAFRYLWNLTQ